MLKLQYSGQKLLEPAPRYKLEDDPQCGLTTGGQEDCFWDCDIVFDDSGFGLFTSFTGIHPVGINSTNTIQNPECLLDCFYEVCLCHLLYMFL